MRRVFQVVCFICICLCAIAPAKGYEITKVIEVGRGSGGIVGTPKWSPDGTKLAYFRDTVLCISDTLGNSRDVVALDMPPHKLEWMSNGEVVIALWKIDSQDTHHYRLVRVDINSRGLDILEESAQERNFNKSSLPGSFDGPELSVESNVYYWTNTVTRPNSGPRGIKFPGSRYRDNDSTLLPSNNHVLVWGHDCLWMVSGDLRDTVRIAPKLRWNWFIPPVLTYDRSRYVYFNGTVCRLPDSSYTFINKHITERPDRTVVRSCMYSTPNPVFPEVLFTATCDDGVSYEVRWVATFNYRTETYTNLQDLIARRECTMPSYAPDGRRLSVVCDGKLLIVDRRGDI